MLRTKIHIVLSSIGVILGISAFICFCIVYDNVEAAVWALLSSVHAGLALTLHCHYLMRTLHTKFSRTALQYIGDFGMLGFISGLALTIFYLFLQLYYQRDVVPIDDSFVIRLVWSFMMLKWGLRLWWLTRSYLHTYDQHLITETHYEET